MLIDGVFFTELMKNAKNVINSKNIHELDGLLQKRSLWFQKNYSAWILTTLIRNLTAGIQEVFVVFQPGLIHLKSDISKGSNVE